MATIHESTTEMFFIIGDIWTIITVKLIGGYSESAWFLTRTAFYLTLFLILSAIVGVTALILGQGRDELGGAVVDTGDGLYWRDRTSGQLHHVGATQNEYCAVQDAERGLELRGTTLSRLTRSPALFYCQFDASPTAPVRSQGSLASPGTPGAGIHHVDDLDPQTAGPETTGMTESLLWVDDHESTDAALSYCSQPVNKTVTKTSVPREGERYAH